MIKKLLLIGCFLSLFTSLSAQTLSAGDIAIIGVNFDTSPNYEITIVTLAPIVANTQIRISDYWYNESTPNTLTNVSDASGIALKAEGGILWQPTAAITPGTVFKIEITKGANIVTGLPGMVTVTGWTDPSPTASPGNPGGENWFIYQGNSITNVSNFIFLWGNGFPFAINSINITAGKFVTTGIGNLSLTTVTYLPPSLTLGTNAIALTTVTYHGDNNVYTGIRTGTKESILAEICNISKWSHDETIAYDINPGGASFPGTNPIFTLSTPNTAPTDINLSANTINENVAGNSTIGSLTSTDANAGDTFTYTLVAGTGDTDNASFNINGSDLRITASPDFETKSSYSVRIRTTDQGSLTFEKAFTITINDLAEGVLLSTSPTLTFTQNSSDITGDNIASDGEGGSQSISDIDIQIYNISNTSGTLSSPLTWKNNIYLNSSNGSYTALTNQDGSKGMAIKSANGSEFKLNQFTYYNWGEGETTTNTVKGYRNGSEVASTTFEAYNSGYNPFIVSLDLTFANVDEVRFYITAGGYFRDQSATNHSINSIKVSSPVVTSNTAPTDINLSATSINENVSANSAVGTLSSTDADASNTFTYTLVAGTGSTDNTAFTITGNSLTINASPDFETKSSYSVRIRTTDQGGLSFEKIFAVTVNNLCDIVLTAASQTNIACNGGSTGAATVNAATGGTGPYTYNWTPGTPTGDGTVSVTGLTPGVWTCTVTDNMSCSTTRDFTITQPSAISTATGAQTNVSCNGGSNGTATVITSGGAGGYTYSWSSTGGTAATATSLAVGSHTVTVTDANGCTATRNFIITQPTAISTAAGAQTNVSCNGGSNGSASVTPSGGTPGYTYSWSPSGGTAAAATSLAVGSHTVTVTDANGCTATRNFIITQPTAINTATGSKTNVSCNGGSNGSASVTPSGGAPAYTYSWSPSGGTAATASSLAVGSHTVTVTDANGCTATRNFIITQPTAINTATGSKTNVSCNGGSNGSASVTPSGGAPAYTYSWSPSGGTAATASSLAVGSHTVTVTDANGCTATRNFIITQPTAISTATAAQTNVSCNGGSNGSASVTPSGGTPGYTYSWSPSGGTAATATALSAGTYTVTVTDANACTATRNFTITQPTTISTATAAQTNVSCNGGSNGSASVTPSGGTPGYTYSWSPSGGTAATATALSAGTYTVTVTDANACTATRNFTITQPTAISTATAAQTNVSCNGGSNGSASVTPSGGAGGYTYSWSPSGGTAATATSLAVGSHTVTVTDANGCTATRNFIITQPTAISTATAAQTNVSCNGGSNGSASVTPSGGAGGYTYSWSPSGGTAATATALSAGTYTVTVTDANSCTATRNFTITQPTTISTATAAQTNVSCNGGSNGVASVTPSGGAGGYTYSWSPSGGTAATATALSAGTYTVTVTDANSCTATRNFTITQPTAISTATAAQTNVSCNGGSNGVASVTPSGGAGGYTYSWSPSGGTAATATALSAGTYTVTVTDANSCTATRNFTITQPTAISTATAAQTNVSCNGGSNGVASVTPSGGAGGYTYSWSPSGGTAATATALSAGTYTVTVTDANSCTSTRNFTITQPTTISTATAAQTNVSCNGGSNGSASVTPSGGAGGYTYSWSPSGGTAATATALVAGSYTVTVTDANSCTATRNFTITQPTTINFTTTVLSGYDYNTGYTQTIVASGGTGSKTYAVTAGSLPSGFSLSTAGQITGISTQIADSNFTVTATDANSCTATYNYVLKLNQIPITVTATPSQTKVYGESDPVLTYTVSPSLLSGDSFTGSLTRVSGENIDNYAINQSSLSAGSKYLITYVGANFTITAKPITVTANTSQTKVYGTTDPVFNYTVSPSLVGSDAFTGALTRVAGENIGTYAINQGSLNAGSNYTISYAGANFTITAKPITVTVTPLQTKVYGTTDLAFAYTVSPNLVDIDAFTGALTRVAGENIGNYAINQGSLTAGSNYTISFVSTNFAITAKPITVMATASQTKVYGTTNPVFAYTVSPSLVGSDAFTGALTRVPGENIGNYAITLGNLSAGTNYNITYVSKDFTITAKPITVTANASQTKVYGTANPVYSYTVSPSLVSGDAFTGALTRAAGENIGNYAMTQGNLSAGSNYTITYVSKDFTITAKPITVTANTSQTKVYGTTDPVFNYTVSPSLVGSDAFTGALTRVPGENIGTYAINQGSLSAGSNYTISYVGANFTITAKPITVTATPSQTKVYGTTDPAFAYTVSPSLIGSDAFTGTLTRVAGENIGNYAINQGSLTAGSNYTISFVSANFAITAKPLTVMATASQTKVYGTMNPFFAYTVSPSLVGSDAFTGDLTRVPGENIGNYAITLGNLSAGTNYNITYVSKDFTITAKPITVTANASQTKVYGTTDPVFAYTVSPSIVSGDSFTGALTRAAGENVGVYAITQGTLSAGGNYTIMYNDSDFTITKADQVITWNQTLGLGCNEETSIVLTAVANSGLAVNYASSNTNIATVSNNSLIFQNYGPATITSSQPGNMNYNAAPTVVLPVVSSQPNLIRKQFENIIFFDNSSKSFKSYSWYKNGVLVPGQTSQYFKESGTLNGTYYAVATKLDGTLITTCTLTLSPTIEEEYIRVVPNPVRSNASFQLMTNVSTIRLQNARVELFNLTGNLLTTINTSQNTIDMIAPSVEGIYIVKMTLANGKYFTKTLLVRN